MTFGVCVGVCVLLHLVGGSAEGEDLHLRVSDNPPGSAFEAALHPASTLQLAHQQDEEADAEERKAGMNFANALKNMNTIFDGWNRGLTYKKDHPDWWRHPPGGKPPAPGSLISREMAEEAVKHGEKPPDFEIQHVRSDERHETHEAHGRDTHEAHSRDTHEAHDTHIRDTRSETHDRGTHDRARASRDDREPPAWHAPTTRVDRLERGPPPTRDDRATDDRRPPEDYVAPVPHEATRRKHLEETPEERLGRARHPNGYDSRDYDYEEELDREKDGDSPDRSYVETGYRRHRRPRPPLHHRHHAYHEDRYERDERDERGDDRRYPRDDRPDREDRRYEDREDPRDRRDDHREERHAPRDERDYPRDERLDRRDGPRDDPRDERLDERRDDPRDERDEPREEPRDGYRAEHRHRDYRERDEDPEWRDREEGREERDFHEHDEPREPRDDPREISRRPRDERDERDERGGPESDFSHVASGRGVRSGGVAFGDLRGRRGRKRAAVEVPIRPADEFHRGRAPPVTRDAGASSFMATKDASSWAKARGHAHRRHHRESGARVVDRLVNADMERTVPADIGYDLEKNNPINRLDACAWSEHCMPEWKACKAQAPCFTLVECIGRPETIGVGARSDIKGLHDVVQACEESQLTTPGSGMSPVSYKLESCIEKECPWTKDVLDNFSH